MSYSKDSALIGTFQMSFKDLVIFVLIVLLSGCATADRASLDKSGLAGRWKAYNSRTMDIYCTGAFNRTGVSDTYVLVGDVHTEGQGSWIKKVTGDGFVVGPLGLTYHVTQWPHLENGVTRMTVDNTDWELVERFQCQ